MHYTHNTVLTKEVLDETGARLEHSIRRPLAQLARKVRVSRTVRKATKTLHLRPYKIRQVQLSEEDDLG